MGVLVAGVRGLQLPAADPAWRHGPQAPEPVIGVFLLELKLPNVFCVIFISF